MKLPRWIKDRDVCEWCRQPTMTARTVEDLPGGKGIRITYVCSNDDCRCRKAMKTRNKMPIRMEQPGFIEAWKNFQKEIEENN